MNIGLYDVDSHNFPNLALMKISSYHKAKGDNVEMIFKTRSYYDKIYVSKVFSEEYSTMDISPIMLECCANEVVYGGTGFAITVKDGKEVYDPSKDKPLPDEIEHCYPDYSLYPELTKDTAYGFLTRGCCNNCSFCIVTKKEGICSCKVADLNEWWSGQKKIVLMDSNILACKERNELLDQLAKSGAEVDFNSGLDARFCTEEVCHKLKKIKTNMVHFAFDFMKNEDRIREGLMNYKKIVNPDERKTCVYILTNYDTTFDQDLYRVRLVQDVGFTPDVRVYRKSTAPKITRWLQRWCNNRFIYRSCDFLDYTPLANGKKVKDYLDEKLTVLTKKTVI